MASDIRAIMAREIRAIVDPATGQEEARDICDRCRKREECNTLRVARGWGHFLGCSEGAE